MKKWKKSLMAVCLTAAMVLCKYGTNGRCVADCGSVFKEDDQGKRKCQVV